MMAVLVAAAFALALGSAGSLGVPYFSFTADGGSHCRNNLAGFTCDPLTRQDLQFYADVQLPPDTKIIGASYTETHDYSLSARLQIPKMSAAAANQSLAAAYGKTCAPDHYSPLDATGLSHLCVRANDDTVTSGTPSGRLYVVASGIAKDGSMAIEMEIKSR